MKEKNKSPMILIVDDVPGNIQIAANFLKREDYQLAFAQNGKAALDMANNKPVDLILLDVMMPEMDGFEVCAKLKESEKTKDIPVIFLTGKVENENVVHGLETGAVDYLTKPFKGKELIARVKNHLELKLARERINTLYQQIDNELEVASRIQRKVMREKAEVPFLSSAMVFKPFGKVSGDMVDLFITEKGDFRIFLGDVTGHGIPAALITMMVPFVLDGKIEEEKTSETIARINNTLNQRDIDGVFITGIYAKIASDGSLFCSNAGHHPLLILPADGSDLIQVRSGGMAMGMFPAELIPPYEEDSYKLKKGDKFFLYTDGITEWKNSDFKEFGEDRLYNCLRKKRSLRVKEILDNLMIQIENFVLGTPCDDDYAIIGFEYLG